LTLRCRYCNTKMSEVRIMAYKEGSCVIFDLEQKCHNKRCREMNRWPLVADDTGDTEFVKAYLQRGQQ